MANNSHQLIGGGGSLLDATIAVCFLGDLCLDQISDDSLGRTLACLIDKPNMFRWQRAYSRICGAHGKDIIDLDITPLAPQDELNSLHAAMCDRDSGSADWQHQLQILIDRATHSGVKALAMEALYLPHPTH